MKLKTLFIVIIIFSLTGVHAQQFISKAVIEYEVKSNIKKTMGSGAWADMLKDNLPTFKTGYYSFTFADNKSIYKFDHWDEKIKIPQFLKTDDEGSVWYYDFNSGKYNMQKNVFGTSFNIEDTIRGLEWKLSNENRIIAGFNCRKAVAKIFDSVYVFAFYTDEITIPGGPCSINGLPGTILGVTIPRLFTSWIATKVTLTGVQENTIKPVAVKKNYNQQYLKTMIEERTKDWHSSGADDEEKQQMNRFIWTLLL